MAINDGNTIDPSRRIRAVLGEEFTANVEADALNRIVSQANVEGNVKSNNPTGPVRNDKFDVSEYIFKKWKPGKLIIGYLVATITYFADTMKLLANILYLFPIFLTSITLEFSKISPEWFVIKSHKPSAYFTGLNWAWWLNSIAAFTSRIGKDILSKILASKFNFSNICASSLIFFTELASVVYT